jgi:ATP-dependent DNA helicase RecQ
MSYDRFDQGGDDDEAEVAARQRAQSRDMFRLASAATCRHQAVTRHLGERMEACGTSCDVCGGWDLLGAAGEIPAAARARGDRPARSATLPPADDPADAEVVAALKALRKQLADERGVPAYIVFSDATLLHMAQRRPASAAELLAIPGVGPKKLQLYGPRFLALLAPHPGPLPARRGDGFKEQDPY